MQVDERLNDLEATVLEMRRDIARNHRQSLDAAAYLMLRFAQHLHANDLMDLAALRVDLARDIAGHTRGHTSRMNVVTRFQALLEAQLTLTL